MWHRNVLCACAIFIANLLLNGLNAQVCDATADAMKYHSWHYRSSHYPDTFADAMNEFVQDIDRCLEVLHAGGTILYPTDTIWGIGCDATNAAAVERIVQLKHRPEHKSFVVLVASERDVLQHVAAVDLAVFDHLQQSKRPTTVIYDHALGLAGNVLAEDGSVAIRICNDEFCRHLIKRFRRPILSTSANISGHPAPSLFSEIGEEIKMGVDHVVQYRQDDDAIAQPSSIIKWRDGKVEIIRP